MDSYPHFTCEKTKVEKVELAQGHKASTCWKLVSLPGNLAPLSIIELLGVYI